MRAALSLGEMKGGARRPRRSRSEGGKRTVRNAALLDGDLQGLLSVAAK